MFSFVLCAGTCVFLWCIAEFVACITCCSCKLYVKSSCFHYHFNALQLIVICDRSGVVLYTILSVQITHWNANEWICFAMSSPKKPSRQTSKQNQHIEQERKKLQRNNNKSFFFDEKRIIITSGSTGPFAYRMIFFYFSSIHFSLFSCIVQLFIPLHDCTVLYTHIRRASFLKR